MNTVTLTLEDYNELRDFKTNILSDDNYPVIILRCGKYYFLNETDAILLLRNELEQSNITIKEQIAELYNLQVKQAASSLKSLHEEPESNSNILNLLISWFKRK